MLKYVTCRSLHLKYSLQTIILVLLLLTRFSSSRLTRRASPVTIKDIQLLKKIRTRIKSVLYYLPICEFSVKELHDCTPLHTFARHFTLWLASARHCTLLHTYGFLINRPGRRARWPSRASGATQMRVKERAEYSGYSSFPRARRRTPRGWHGSCYRESWHGPCIGK